MPFGNGTGPAGMGPMTGRGAGYCAGYGRPGYMNPHGGRGYGYGYGYGFGRGGHGYRNWYHATGLTGWQRAATGYPVNAPYAPPYVGAGYANAPYMNKEQEVDILKRQAEYFENALNDIRKQIDDLETQTEKSD